MSARYVKIANCVTHRYFTTEADFDGVTKTKSIKCAFIHKIDCGPECAACEQTGSCKKAVCNRGGFDIGFIKD